MTSAVGDAAPPITCQHCGTEQKPFIEWDEILCRSCDKKMGDA